MPKCVLHRILIYIISFDPKYDHTTICVILHFACTECIHDAHQSGMPTYVHIFMYSIVELAVIWL